MSLSVDWLAEKIAEDFTARGVTAEVVYGAEKASQAKPGPRVVVGLDPSFEIGPPGVPNAPGLGLLPGATQAARSLMTRQQRVAIQVIVPPPAGSDRNPNRSKLAHQLCAALLHEVCTAIHRKAHGSVVMLGGEWQGTESADFHYPAEVHLSLVLHIPVLDIKWPKVEVESFTTRLYAVDPGDGSETLDAVTPAAP